MANQSRPKTSNLVQDAHQFDFFQLVRILKKQLQNQSLFFKTLPSLAHAINDIDHIADQGQTRVVWVTFMGLIGQSGVLPDHFLELILEKNNEKDTSLYQFINLFSHRLIALFYDAWQKARYFIDLDNDENTSNAMLGLIDALTGIDIRNATNKKCNMIRYYAGLFNQSTRSKQDLIALIKDYFNLTVTVDNYVGKWLFVEKHAKNKLGIDALLGNKAWYAQNQICINIHNVDYVEFQQLWPDQPLLTALKEAINIFLSGEYEFSLKIRVNSATIPVTTLEPDRRFNLGWNTWLKSKKSTQINIPVNYHA